jgi:hypothetical protein
MKHVDLDWASEQLASVRAKKAVGASVMAMLEAWKDLKHADKDSAEVLSLLSKLAMAHSLLQDASEEVWVEARPGAISVGDIVRVRHDAYDGKLGTLHNGRVGKVVAVRYGDIIFRSTDEKVPFLDGTHHSPHKLEKRIK